MQDADIRIVTYSQLYFDSLISILRRNTPAFFSAKEEADFIHYLNFEIEDYYVVLVGDTVVGAGGINYSPNAHEAIISWDMILPEYQRKYVGTRLLIHRLNRIQENKTISKVIVRTSQYAHQFYQKYGFELVDVKRDYWDKGFDLYFMEKQLLN